MVHGSREGASAMKRYRLKARESGVLGRCETIPVANEFLLARRRRDREGGLIT